MIEKGATYICVAKLNSINIVFLSLTSLEHFASAPSSRPICLLVMIQGRLDRFVGNVCLFYIANNVHIGSARRLRQTLITVEQSLVHAINI